MRPTRATFLHLIRQVMPFALLTALLTAGLVATWQNTSQASGQASNSTLQTNLHQFGGIKPSACGSQIGYAGFSATLRSSATTADGLHASLALGANDLAPEFRPLTSTAPSLRADPAAQALALDRAWLVHDSRFGSMSDSAVLAKLRSQPDVATAEQVWLQSTDHRYLSCDYKVKDNTTDQALATMVRQALIVRGISAAKLDDAGTMEFVSLRHFNRRQVLQVAFVRRPVGGASVAYVALLDPGTRAVLATARANWYLWG